MQDLSELTDQLDLDAALARTHDRHRELVHQRAVRRRWVTGTFAVLVVAAVALLPQLGSDDRGQTVRFAGPGGSSTAGPDANQDAGGATDASSTPHLPSMSVVPSGFSLDVDGDGTFVLTRDPDTLPPDVVIGYDGGAIAGGVVGQRPVGITGTEAATRPDAITVHFECVGAADQLIEVRFRFDGDVLLVDAEVLTASSSDACAAGSPGASVTLPLDRDWPAGGTAEAARL